MKLLPVGLSFLAIAALNILLASAIIRFVAIVGDLTFRNVGFLCLATIAILSIEQVHAFFERHKMFAVLVWETGSLGMIPYPLFVFKLWLHHSGSIFTITYVQRAALPALILFIVGIYLSFRFFAKNIYPQDASTT